MLVIYCPSCSAGLQLPRSVLASRARRICCAICEHRWVEAPVMAEDHHLERLPAETGPELSLHAENSRSDGPAVEPPQDALKQVPDPSGEQAVHGSPPGKAARAGRRRPGRSRTAPLAWRNTWSKTWPRMAASFGAMALLLLGLGKREDIVRVVPPLAGAYAAIGLPVNVQGLEWREVRTSLAMESSLKVLAVEGEIRNLRGQSQTLPDIQLSLRDKSGREIYAWKAPAPKADLSGGETIPFRARLASPPGSAAAVRVVFAEATADRMTP